MRKQEHRLNLARKLERRYAHNKSPWQKST